MKVTAEQVRQAAAGPDMTAIVAVDREVGVARVDDVAMQRMLADGRATVLVSHEELLTHLLVADDDAQAAADSIGEREV